VPGDLHFEVKDESELPAAVSVILSSDPGLRVFLLFGDQGTGKTTLVKAICRALGSNDNFSSPTYPIVNEYDSVHGSLFHIDLYRLSSKKELFDAGIGELITSGDYCFIEWPQLAQEFVKDKYMRICLEDHNNFRQIRTKIVRP
jgi:tRNA threonylcarbamoyladenosine biosynthesis protein TsaE